MRTKRKEVNPVLSSLFNQNLQPRTTNLNAIHNHFLEEEPDVKFIHGTAIGDPVHTARALLTVVGFVTLGDHAFDQEGTGALLGQEPRIILWLA
jgi:hypothetical protein